ncbi:MAG: right-handed parallel beta-helix repeat-containing protein [Bryobacteraceae bacterium]|nr:right-handed parallel beta-helix repeat-containing protein [Bryobacteraceae bacterium]
MRHELRGGLRSFALVAAALQAFAQSPAPATLYVSPRGDDRNSGVTPAHAWRSLDRVQQAIDGGVFASGGLVLLERGGVYPGRLAISGRKDFALSSYGAGALPEITGLARLANWERVDGHRWRSVCNECAQAPSILIRDGRTLPLARWPNSDAPDGGYRFYRSASGSISITDPRLPSGIDWTGAEVVLRTAPWILDRLPVISHRGAVLTFGRPATYSIPEGFGYFLQNHPAALDRDGEWIFDPATRSITVFLASTTPADHQFAVSVIDRLLHISRADGIDISDIQLTGSRIANLEIRDSARVRIANVFSRQAGELGIGCIKCRDFQMRDSDIEGALNTGLDVYECSNCLVERNRVRDIATIAGMGRGGDAQYNGVNFGGRNAVLSRNQVSRTGYLGIDVRGSAEIIQNLVSDFNLVKTDGAGIYMWRNRDVRVTGNLVRNGVGAKGGVPWTQPATHGIYIDDQSENVAIAGNSVLGVEGYGIFLHNTRGVRIDRNTVVDGGQAQVFYDDSALGSFEVTGTAVRDNVFVGLRAGALQSGARSTGSPAFYRSLGWMSGNLYCAPFAEAVFGSSVPEQPRMLLETWQRLVGTDSDSRTCGARYELNSVRGVTGPDRVANGRFDADLQYWFGWPMEALSAAWDSGRLRLRHTGAAPLIHYDTFTGPVEAGQYYRIRFDAFSDQPDRILHVYLRKAAGDFGPLTQAADVRLGPLSRRYELVFRAQATESGSLAIFELPNASQVVWLDNVQVEPVDVAAAPPEAAVRVEVNDTFQPRILAPGEELTEPSGRVWAPAIGIPLDPLSVRVFFRRIPTQAVN